MSDSNEVWAEISIEDAKKLDRIKEFKKPWKFLNWLGFTNEWGRLEDKNGITIRFFVNNGMSETSEITWEDTLEKINELN